MSEYKRLTERHENGYIELMCNSCKYNDKCDVETHYCNEAVKNCLAELEDKIENGTLKEFSKDSVVLSKEEYERLVKTAQGKISNMKATDFLKACISSGVMVEAVSTKEQVRQAVKKFADELKAKSYVNDYCREVVEIEKIDELLKEYEK